MSNKEFLSALKELESKFRKSHKNPGDLRTYDGQAYQALQVAIHKFEELCNQDEGDDL